MSSYNKKSTSSYFQKKKKPMAEKVRDASSDYFGKAKSPKASKVVTPKMLTDKGFSNNKEGLRDFMNTFKYDKDKGYVKRSKALKRVGETSKLKSDAPKPKLDAPKPKSDAPKPKVRSLPNLGSSANILPRDLKKPKSKLERLTQFAGSGDTGKGPKSMADTLRKQGKTPLQMADSMNLTGAKKIDFLNKEGMRRKAKGAGPSRFKKGGVVKTKMKITNKASKRADGIARKGKTKGRMI